MIGKHAGLVIASIIAVLCTAIYLGKIYREETLFPGPVSVQNAVSGVLVWTRRSLAFESSGGQSS